MDAPFIQEILKQAPLAAFFAVALYIVYNDWKADRQVANQQREQMIEQLIYNTIALQTLAQKLNIQLPTQQDVRDNTHRLQQL